MFGVIGDPHIVSKRHISTKWLKENVSKLNKLDLDFVLVCGDISNLGRIDELQLAKEILDELHAKYYCCHGNHDYVVDGGTDLTPFRTIFGATQFVTQVCNYNLLVLQMVNWAEPPLEINQELPSIALIHGTSKTMQNLLFPLFDYPELADFFERHNVKCVFQGHVHVAGNSEAFHRGVRYINCPVNRVGLGILDNPILYVPVKHVGDTNMVEEAYLQLLSMREQDND